MLRRLIDIQEKERQLVSYEIHDGLAQYIAGAIMHLEAHLHEVPAIVVPCIKGRVDGGPATNPPAFLASHYGSIYPSVQNLLLAARAMGLGASLITLPLWSVTMARRTLGLPVNVQPICMVPLGWPRGRYGTTTRKPVGDVVHLDRFGQQPWRGIDLSTAPDDESAGDA
jgi:nitroreductase